ncbi:hypothetical protein D922_00184 [Enterococcus faecalis 06-MB-DW-09]|jgi:hypothetical protein|nr:hypothetical protein D922_00184 [Enterococcus faecalis 06-MB-DW-09]
MDRDAKVFSAAIAIGVCVGLAASVLATKEYRERAGQVKMNGKGGAPKEEP